jgi:hypothetical protein
VKEVRDLSFTRTVLLLIVITMLVVPAWGQQAVSVYVDGKKVVSEVPPRMYGTWIYVPLRGVFEKLGAQVSYSRATGMVTVTKPGVRIRLKAGQSFAQVNGAHRPMLTAPFEEKGRILVPLRFVVETLGCQVSWNPALRTVHISSKAAEKDEYEINTE